MIWPKEPAKTLWENSFNMLIVNLTKQQEITLFLLLKQHSPNCAPFTQSSVLSINSPCCHSLQSAVPQGRKSRQAGWGPMAVEVFWDADGGFWGSEKAAAPLLTHSVHKHTPAHWSPALTRHNPAHFIYHASHLIPSISALLPLIPLKIFESKLFFRMGQAQDF